MASRAGAGEVMEIGGRSVPVRFRSNRRARRLILHIDPKTDGVQVTLPRGSSKADGRRFVEEKRDWVEGRLDGLPPKIPFEDGAVVPVLGENCRLNHRPDLQGGVMRTGSDILVTGRAEHFARRVTDWCRRECQMEAAVRAERLAREIGRRVRRVSVRDTRSRWGSCSLDGNLSFNWRLIFAPDWVLEYVVAHEVSHLAHHDHGPAFWKTVEELDVRATEAKSWLNGNMERLQRIG